MPSSDGQSAGTNPEPLRLGVLVSASGRGTNLQSLIDRCADGAIQAEVSLVIGTASGAQAIERARNSGIPTRIISPLKYPQGDDYGQQIIRMLAEAGAGLVCLAGYMRRLPTSVIHAYAGRVMNIHPALLPFFGGQGMYGQHVHEAVIGSGMKVTGCTVHFVDEHYDTGPIVVQYAIPVNEDDTPAALAERLLPVEHRAYAEAVNLFAAGRLRIEGCRVRVLPA